MKRSVYSLVLMDDVITAIDQMAYQMNTSRSNLINQILAEKVMLVTPEMRMKNIFDKMMEAMEDYKKFQVQLQPSDYCISIRSALNYKYNPTIRYFIELYRSGDTAIGELKITSRTQSEQLQTHLYQFFQYFSRIEQVYIIQYFPERPVPHFMQESEGRFVRKLTIADPKRVRNTDMIANAIGNYVQMLDGLLSIYLTHLRDLKTGTAKIEKEYVTFLNSEPILV